MLDPPSSLAKPTAAVQVGDVIHSKYRVERVIGEGGMGIVVAAKHLTLDRPVALKVLSTKSQESKEALERFTREARAAARIQSEHVGRVLDVDTLPNGGPFIVMELLEGHDLAGELRMNGKLSVERAVGSVLQACEAIAEAHVAGIVHRDLKPANLFLSKTSTGSTTLKVLDFGISKITRRDEDGATTADKALTHADSMLGSPLYMSPEQMQASSHVDLRTDIWSLGVILYELVTNRSPFDANTVPMICAAVLSRPPPPLDLADAPAGLEQVIFRCLEKEPARRYRDIAHLARALAPFAPAQAAITTERIMKLRDDEGRPGVTPATLPPPAAPARAKEGSLTITSWGEKKPVVPVPRSKTPFVIVGVVGLGGIALAAVLLSSSTAPRAQEDTPAADPTSTTTITTAAATSEVGAASATASAIVSASAVASVSASVEPSASESTSVASASATHSIRPGYPYSGRPVIKPTTTKSTHRTTGFGGRE